MAQQAVTNGIGKERELARPADELVLPRRQVLEGRRPCAAVGGADRDDRDGACVHGYSRHRLEQPRLVDVEQEQHEQDDEEQEREQHEAGQRLRAERQDEQEHGLEVEQDEDDRDRVVLDRHRLDVERARPASRRIRRARA